jgi:hypothetical protein
MGVAWGIQCEPCPTSGTEEYKELCMESGYTVEGYGKLILQPNSNILILCIQIFK